MRPAMRRGLAIGLLIGWMLGLGTVYTVGYDYQLLPNTRPALLEDMIASQHWEIVPGQSNPYYIRRQRLRLP